MNALQLFALRGLKMAMSSLGEARDDQAGLGLNSRFDAARH